MNNLDISYPCVWEYLVITSDIDSVSKYIESNFNDRKYNISNSKTSKFGKYTSLKININVFSQKDRDNLFQNINEINGVNIVI